MDSNILPPCRQVFYYRLAVPFLLGYFAGEILKITVKGVGHVLLLEGEQGAGLVHLGNDNYFV
ncbi:MAG: hypothetical protein QHH10_14130 [Peptococcaceae bacterium]|nr:hypothetical protein [Peptococcaceae bacterium]MDH7526434.1 hypothetical protein [Peptococcaceae bacterium]